MRYEVRRVSPDDLAVYRTDRWAIHEQGKPLAVRGFALTKRTALRRARRWMRQRERSRRSFAA